MSQFNSDRHNTQYGDQYIHSHWMDRIRKTGCGHENNDPSRKCCSFVDFTPLVMSEVANHISTFHVWIFLAGPGYCSKYDAN